MDADGEDNFGRDFKQLDAREVQEALAEELMAEGNAEDQDLGDGGSEEAPADAEAGADADAEVEAAAEETGEALSSDALSSDALPSDALPSDALPSDALPPDDSTPDSLPAEAASEEAPDADQEPGPEQAPEPEQEPEQALEQAPEQAPELEWAEDDIVAHMRMAEALVFAAAEALDEKTIADRLPYGADIKMVMDRLVEDYAARGILLKKVDKCWRFVTAPDVAPILEKEQTTQRKLSRAALETLAIIAYHQPCTRADIEDVRGVQVAKGSLDQLLEIGWVRLRGKRKDAPGRPTLYGTSQVFLEHFGLESVGDLPGLADLKAAGLLDARLPPGFAVPAPADADGDEEIEDEDGETEFATDFMDPEDDESASEG